MLDWLKNRLLKNYIVNNKKNRTKELISLRQAKSIGIICTIESEEEYKNIFSFFSKLQSENKTVRLVGYINENTVPFYCLTQLTADYFCKKDLNWYGKPTMIQVNDFIDIDFDMLIDFSTSAHTPLQLLLQLSQAKFIVGANSCSKEYYDFFIEDDVKNHAVLLNNIDIYSHKLMGERL